MPTEDLEERFAYAPPTTAEEASLEGDLREGCFELAVFFDAKLPDGREKSLAMTAIQDALNWALAANMRGRVQSKSKARLVAVDVSEDGLPRGFVIEFPPDDAPDEPLAEFRCSPCPTCGSAVRPCRCSERRQG